MAGSGGPIQRPLAMMMRPITRTVHPDDTLLAVARQLRDARVGAMLVADHGDYVGIVSEADLVRKAIRIAKKLRELGEIGRAHV